MKKTNKAVLIFKMLLRSGAWIWLCWVGMLAGWPGGAQGQGLMTLRGHLPPPDAIAQPLGDVSSNTVLHLALGLPLHHQDALTNLLRDLYDPASPSFHHFLSRQEFTARFGPTEAEYQQVIRFARDSGFEVGATFSNRTVVEVYGAAPDVERAFHVRMHRYRHPVEARDFFAPDVEPTVQSNLPLSFVGGLNSYLLPREASLHLTPVQAGQNVIANFSGSGPGGYYAGLDFRAAYASGVTNAGSGQSVGLVEFDSYYPSDITNYLAYPGIGLGNVSVTLSNIVFTNLTGLPGAANTEVALDIEMAISMAPGLSKIYVYEATNDEASPDLVLNRMVSDDLSRQLSCSWNGFDDSTIENDLAEFGAQGQSFFQASGDSGAYVSVHNPVQPPSDNPNITVVGGTTVYTTGPEGNWTLENVWSWFSQPLGSLKNAASSGGVSPTWSLPGYQSGISMSANKGSTTHRDLPDVAMVANEIFLVANDGGTYIAGGTSAAAPLWAGFTALLNQQLTAEAQPSAGFMNPALYTLAKGANYSSYFHDTKIGNNTNLYTSTLYFAESGYDLCTGWGSPIGSALIGALAPEPLQISPSSGFASSGVYGGPFTVSNETFTLTNAVTGSINWSFGSSAPWVSATPASGTLTSGGAATAVTVAFNAGASNFLAGSHTNTIWFTNLADAVVQNRVITLTVTQVVPVVTWSSPAQIVYGTALSQTQLDATANVPGSFAYQPASGAVLYAGTNHLTAMFTPSNAMYYASVTSVVNLAVSPAPLVVTAANTNRVYGAPNPVFQGTISGLQNGDNISAAYSCNATQSSSVGTYNIVPSLVDPANLETNYMVTLTSGLLTVSQAAPVVTWSSPAQIVYGTALSQTQLDAAANVPGTFAYQPVSGAVLYVGMNHLNVVFTPTDTTDYASATGSANLAVSPAPLMVTAANTNRLYGTPNPVFQGTISGLQNGDNISATYSCNATQGSPVGTYNIIPTMVDPANLETNYVVTLTSGQLKVQPAPVTITWTDPASVTQGTALSATQLDATASVPGLFAYSPSSGTVLPVGTNLLTAVFTPSDNMDYLGATNTVELVVLEETEAPAGEPLFPGGEGIWLLLGIVILGLVFLRRRLTVAGD